MSLVKDRVKALLVKHPHLRDDDNKLILLFIHKGN